MSETLTPAEAAVKAYLERQIEADAALREKYDASLVKKCFDYITEQARKQADGDCAVVEDALVYKWARDFYLEGAAEKAKEAENASEVVKESLTTEKPEPPKKDDGQKLLFDL